MKSFTDINRILRKIYRYKGSPLGFPRIPRKRIKVNPRVGDIAIVLLENPLSCGNLVLVTKLHYYQKKIWSCETITLYKVMYDPMDNTESFPGNFNPWDLEVIDHDSSLLIFERV